MLSHKTIISTLVGALLLLPLLAQANDLLPTVPKAKAKANPDTLCIRDVNDMRKNHMDYIMHKRDKTMREGVRTKQDSLAECISCHVPKDDKGHYASFGDDKHFCSSCHNYAAVSIDCFDCHNDKPTEASKTGSTKK